MSRWDQVVVSTTDEAKRFWAAAPMRTLTDMMAPPRAWEAWLRIAAGVIVEPGTVFEPGCGIGVLADLLPDGCTYYGCDINEAYVEEARRIRARPGVRFEVRDLEDVLAAGEVFDWVVVTALFGMFPEPATYELIERFWGAARRGLSITTINKRRFPRHPRMRFEFTSHDPDELLASVLGLPGAGRVELHHGHEYPQFRGHYWSRGLAVYAWRASAS